MMVNLGRRSFLTNKYHFKNLVFQGGGIKSYVYHGVLRVLDEYDILPRIERVAGTSAGALQAALLSFRLGVDETIALYRMVDYSRIGYSHSDKDTYQKSRLWDEQLGKARGNLDAANRLIRQYGLHVHDYCRDFLHETIATYCDGNERATFAEFRARNFRDLYTTAVNVSRHRVEIFSADSTPDVAVADAILMSGSIPFFFKALQFDGKSLGQGDYYIDGGALSNYPLTIFDDPAFKQGNRNYIHGINWETLGCRLFTPENCQPQKAEIGNVIQFAENVIETMADAQNVAVDLRMVDRWRSIPISNCCVTATDFDIRPDPDDLKYVEMVQTGDQAARKYLDDYHLPTDRFADVKEKLSEFLEIWH